MEKDSPTKSTPTKRRPRKTPSTTTARPKASRKRQLKPAPVEPAFEIATVPIEDAMKVQGISHEGHRPPLQEPPPSAPPAPPTKPSFTDLAVGLGCALAVLLFLGSQIVSQLQVQTSLVWQLRSSERQVIALENEIATIKVTTLEASALLSRAEEVAESYNALFTDLLTLAESDPDAQAIVAKYQIRTLDPL